MKCKICNEKVSKMHEESGICFYCECLYGLLLRTAQTAQVFYEDKAPKRIPDSISEIIDRLIIYKNLMDKDLKSNKEGSEEWLMNDFD